MRVDRSPLPHSSEGDGPRKQWGSQRWQRAENGAFDAVNRDVTSSIAKAGVLLLGLALGACAGAAPGDGRGDALGDPNAPSNGGIDAGSLDPSEPDATPDAGTLPARPEAPEPAPEDPAQQAEEPTPDVVVTLTVDPIAPTTEWPTVPVKGKGPANGMVVIWSSQEPEIFDTDAQGNFCANVAVGLGVSTIGVQAANANGNYSQMKMIDITRKAPSGPSGYIPSYNAAIGSNVLTNMATEGDAVTSIVDGSGTTGPRFNANITTGEWISLRLPKAVPVAKITVIGSATCHMEAFVIQTAELAADPWSEFYRGTNIQTPVLNALAQGTPKKAQYVAVTPTGYGCGYVSGVYDVREIQVWTAPQGTDEPTPVGPHLTCPAQ